MAVHTRDHILLHQGNNTVELETVYTVRRCQLMFWPRWISRAVGRRSDSAIQWIGIFETFKKNPGKL